MILLRRVNRPVQTGQINTSSQLGLNRLVQRRNYSEFKSFFGYEHQIESTKIKNDTDVDFDNNKMHYLAICLTGTVIGTLCLLLLSPRYRAKCQLTATRLALRTQLVTLHGEHYLPNLTRRLGTLESLTDSYIEGETVRLQHLALLLNKSTRTLQRALNHHPGRFD